MHEFDMDFLLHSTKVPRKLIYTAKEEENFKFS